MFVGIDMIYDMFVHLRNTYRVIRATFYSNIRSHRVTRTKEVIFFSVLHASIFAEPATRFSIAYTQIHRTYNKTQQCMIARMANTSLSCKNPPWNSARLWNNTQTLALARVINVKASTIQCSSLFLLFARCGWWIRCSENVCTYQVFDIGHIQLTWWCSTFWMSHLRSILEWDMI